MTSSSVLYRRVCARFLFDAAHGIDPRGRPVTVDGRIGVFSRASSKTAVDSDGRVYTVPAGQLARTWVLDPTTGLTVPAISLEPQRTNICIRSQEFDTWNNDGIGGTSVTADASVAPDGTMTADLVVSLGVAGRRRRNVTFTGDGTKCAAVFLKAGTSSRTDVAIQDFTASENRHLVRVNWSGGIPSLTTGVGSGTLYPVEPLGDGWWRILFSADGVVAANINRIQLFPDPVDGTGTVLAWGAQAEDAVVPSSYVPTEGTTVTRNADSLYWEVPGLVPEESTFYVRGVLQSPGAATDSPGNAQGILFVGTNSNTTDPRLGIAKRQGLAGFGSLLDDGVTAVQSQVQGTTALVGSVAELRAVIGSDFSINLAFTENNGTEAVGTPQTGAVSFPTFAGQRVYLGAFGGADSSYPFAFTHVLIARGTLDRAYCRTIAGVAA
jgi:hypothetical protein